MSFLDSDNQVLRIRYKAQRDQWMLVGGENDETAAELDEVYFDFSGQNFKLGWLHIAPGIFDPRWNEEPLQGAPQPDELDESGINPFRKAFSIVMFNQDIQRREWTSNGAGAVRGFKTVLDAALESEAKIATHCPLFKYLGSEPLTFKRGSSRMPMFEFVRWDTADKALSTLVSPETVATSSTPNSATTEF